MQAKPLDGATQLYGIVGDPIAAVRSPEVFNAMFARLGVNAVLVPLHVGADDIATGWAGLRAVRNLQGLVVTMPHKASVAALLDELGPAAQIVGAVNAARRGPDGRWFGEMFDGIGFVDGLRDQGHEPRGWHVELWGVGGAGSAIGVALAEAGVASLCLRDQDVARRDALCQRLLHHFPQLRIADTAPPDRPFDAVVNATPLGMRPDDALAFDPATLARETLVVDVITKPETTALLQRAMDTGHRVHSGRHMHFGQARRAAAFFGHALD